MLFLLWKYMHHTVKNLSTPAVLYIYRIWNYKIVYICMYIDKIFYCLQMTNFYLINRWPSLYPEKIFQSTSRRIGRIVVIPCHIDFRFRLHIASSRITSSWPNSKKQISFVIGVGLFTIVYSREEIVDQSGRKEKDRRRGGGGRGLKFVRFLQSRSREWEPSLSLLLLV